MTTVTPEASNEVHTTPQRREAFIQSLRDCANWLEEHPTVYVPRYVNLNVFVSTKEEVAAHARAATWEKIFNDTWFYLRHEFGQDVSLAIAVERETICRKVVVGTEIVPAKPEHWREIVEWVCDDAVLAKVG